MKKRFNKLKKGEIGYTPIETFFFINFLFMIFLINIFVFFLVSQIYLSDRLKSSISFRVKYEANILKDSNIEDIFENVKLSYKTDVAYINDFKFLAGPLKSKLIDGLVITPLRLENDSLKRDSLSVEDAYNNTNDGDLIASGGETEYSNRTVYMMYLKKGWNDGLDYIHLLFFDYYPDGRNYIILKTNVDAE